MNAEVLPRVRLHFELETDVESITAIAVLEGLGESLHARGSASQAPDRDPARPNLGPELAVIRALNDLHHQLLERVHERIDRNTGDI